MLQIQKYKENDKEDWDRYVRKNHKATFFHQIGWKYIIEHTYKHKGYYLLAKDNGKIVGILPLFLIKGFLFADSFVSLPFVPYGGVCANNQEIEEKLIKTAIDIVNAENINFIEFRQFDELNLELQLRKNHVTLLLELNDNPDKLWVNLKDKVRNQVRKAIKSGLTFKVGNEYLDGFYNVYARNMRDIGIPVHSIRLFENLIEQFSNQIKIFIVEKEQEIIGGMLVGFFKNTMSDIWASSLRKYFEYCPNNLLYWGAIKYGCKNGFRYFDFGRSQWNTGTFRFKKQWGAIPHQLYYQYYLNKSNIIPKLDQSSLKYQMFTGIWKKIPLSVANFIGPIIRKNII